MLRFALVLLVASCGKGGVELVVDAGDAPLTKVVLYVGVGDAVEEPIQPAQHGLPYPSSSAWPRDRYNELDEREVVAGEPVVFQFQSEETASQSIGVVIAVGFAGDEPVAAAAASDIAVPSDVIARYELALEPTNAVDADSPLELDIWQPPSGAPKEGKTCVALYDKRTMRADAVVTAGDPDCDGWPTDDPAECQPSYYMSFSRPSLDEVSCLLTERVVTSDGTISDGCVLGGPPCRDGFGPESSCTAPSPYCMPKSVCNRCELTPDDFECARDITQLAVQYPTHLRCKVYFDAAGKPCPDTFQALSNPGPDIAGHHCVPGAGTGVITTKGASWDKRVVFEQGDTQVKVDISNVQPNCNFDIAVSGTVLARQDFAGLVAGMLDNGRGIAIPIVFELDPVVNVGCENQVACQGDWSWDLSELVDQCLDTPAFPP